MRKLDPNSNLYKIRHSLAHILAQAVLEIRPNAKLGFGPPTATGFYYDFDLDEPLSEEDFPLIEKKMVKIIKSGQAFEREELSSDEMTARLNEDSQGYKIEQVEDLTAQNATLSLYRNGPFWDLRWKFIPLLPKKKKIWKRHCLVSSLKNNLPMQLTPLWLNTE